MKMQDYIESDNYILSESEKSYIINDINYLLNSLPEILKTQINQNKIFTSSMICEYMLNLELKNKGYLVKTNTPISDVIDFCKSNSIIPKECVGFLETIPIFRNKDLKPTDKLTDEFIDTFLYSFFSILLIQGSEEIRPKLKIAIVAMAPHR